MKIEQVIIANNSLKGNKLIMKLKNLIRIQHNEVHIIGNLNPPYFYKLSPIMIEFFQLYEEKDYQAAIETLEQKYLPFQINEFKQKFTKFKDKLFENSSINPNMRIDFSRPVSTLTLNITRKCNLKCTYCFEDEDYRKKGSMPFSVAKKAIDMFFLSNPDLVNKRIIFSGGEPLLNYKLIKEVVAYIKKNDLDVDLSIKTNGVLLKDEVIDFLIKNNFKLLISLDGSEEAHNTHRKFPNGKGSFKIVDQSIKKLIEKNYGDNITISGTITHQTIKHIEESYKYINSHDKIKSYSLKQVMADTEEDTFNENDHFALYEAGLKFNKSLTEKAKKIITGEDNICNHICGIGIWNLAIDVDGDIYPCYRMCGKQEYVLGNIDSFKLPVKLPNDIKNIYTLDKNENCSKCYLLTICKSGCYTDKVMNKRNTESYCTPLKKIFLDVFHNEFFRYNKHTFLEII